MKSNDSTQPIVITPLTQEEEDGIIHARINNDERPVRRVVKKFHAYTLLANCPPTSTSLEQATRTNEARDSFLVELAQFRLLLKKSATVCEAEARQVEEYKKEKQRIEDKHGTLRLQIEELKEALEQAQTVRKRKIEYDLIAEKINALPSREELENSIQALENDMMAIRAEHETQNRTILSQKVSLDTIIENLISLRLMGKDSEDFSTPLEEDNIAIDDNVEPIITVDEAQAMQISEEKVDVVKMDVVEEARVESQLTEEDGDIEMGELAEEPKARRKVREDLEEGEATDGGSDVSDPPDA